MNRIISLVLTLILLNPALVLADNLSKQEIINHINTYKDAGNYSGATSGDIPFKGGVELPILAKNLVLDFFETLSQWAGCVRWELIGYCIKCEGPFCWITPYIAYHFPTALHETADMFQSMLTLSQQFDLYGDPKEYWHPNAKKYAHTSVNTLRKTIGLSEGEEREANIDISSLSENINSPIKNAAVHKEFHSINTLLQMFYAGLSLGDIFEDVDEFEDVLDILTKVFGTLVPFGPCHKGSAAPFTLTSEMPLMIDMSRLSQLSYFLHPKEMLQLRGLSKEMKGYNVMQLCTQFNMKEGATPINAPLNLQSLFPGPMMPLKLAKKLCTLHVGPDYPTTTYLPTRDFNKASAIALNRGNNLFFDLLQKIPGLPNPTFDVKKYGIGNLKHDTVQYRYPKSMPKSCKTDIGDYGDFRDGNYSPVVDDEIPEYAQQRQWSGLRCCEGTVWIGPRPKQEGKKAWPPG
ncbi:MAG: hypothetical protein H6619_06320 [Deltaproteobacteria bacterium]|nr:hypothetical protein [Deltaproteobacteria bacterium]